MKAKSGLLLGILLVVLPTLVFLLACQAEARTVVVLSSSPEAGVSVRLVGKDGEAQGVTPWKVSLPPGEYSYTAVAPGYRMNSGTVRIEAGTTTQVVIPPLERAAGMVEVRSNAAVTVCIDGVEAGKAGPDPSRWHSFGPFGEGRHRVRAESPLGVQEKDVLVSSRAPGRAEFLWGSRLAVVVEPAGVLSATVLVDGQPYRGPMDFAAEHLSTRPYVELAASAPGYAPWVSETVFLPPGLPLTVTVHLTPSSAVSGTMEPAGGGVEEEVLAALQRYWEVARDGWARMDASVFPEVLTGEALEVEAAAVEEMRAHYTSVLITASVTSTPTVQVLGESTCTVVIPSCGYQVTYVQPDGARFTSRSVQTAVLLFVRGEDGKWRIAHGESEAVSLPTPTPAAGGGGGGAGSRPAPADRRLVMQLVWESINCNLSTPLPWDQELSDLLARYVDSRQGVEEALAGLSPRGWLIASWGIALSFVPANAYYGEFAYDWENYAGRGCDTHYADPWAAKKTAHCSRIGMAIGEPQWTGVAWDAWMLIACR